MTDSSAPMISLAGQVAIVTGGTRGLGREIARVLAVAGCTVAVCGRNAPDSLPDGVRFHAVDVRDPEQAKAFVDDVAQAHGRLDILVNNAGGSPAVDAATASPRFSEAIIRLNLIAPLNLAQAAHAHMARAKSGLIVNITSVSAIRPSPGTAAYGAAKAGLVSLTQSLAQEWGADGIRVNAVLVGLAETETADQTYGDAAAQARVAASIPLGRMARGEDVANAILYLASPLASYVSGAQLEVYGGGEKPHFIGLVEGK
jgi:NAD(P)-dependent dehydrogenase (short-subunit alcohol dehydrogenase family)